MSEKFFHYQKTIARILDSQGTVWGAGFLLSENYLVTCAHIIIQILGLNSDSFLETPQDIIGIDFPNCQPQLKRQAKVVIWKPYPQFFEKSLQEANRGEDLALLKLDKPLELHEVKLVNLTLEKPKWGSEFRLMGFPSGSDLGLFTSGKIYQEIGNRWLALKVNSNEPPIEGGFSGAPLWGETEEAVTGIVAAANEYNLDSNRAKEVAYAIPASVVTEFWLTYKGELQDENKDQEAKKQYFKVKNEAPQVIFPDIKPPTSIVWRALAWDDHPEELKSIQRELGKRYATELIITENDGDFFDYYYHHSPWNFLILDVQDNRGVYLGSNIARRIRAENSEIPIIFLTINNSIILNDEINIQSPVLIKSKDLSQGILAFDIINYIKSISYDYKKVFLIYGHGKKAPGFRERIEAELKRHQLKPILLTTDQAMNAINESLVTLMKECGVIIAICTPDDKIGDNCYQPRQNVLLEIGIAMSLVQGFRRLVILQRWGATPDTQAKLPSDLGGIFTLRFSDDNLDSVLGTMLRALEKRKIKLVYPD